MPPRRLSEKLTVPGGTTRTINSAQLREIRQQAEQLEADNDRLKGESAEARLRALEARSAPRASLAVTEAKTYGPGSSFSWFVDLYKAERGGNPEARKRLDAHAREAAADAPRRAELRARAAQMAFEALFASTPGEQRALAAWTGAGRVLFERRAVTRVDGQSGYFVPPGWLVDEYVPAPRADAALATAVTQAPLPEYCDSINIPRIATGIGAGAQVADATMAPGSDLTDSFAGSGVITVSGTQDVSAQWLDQGAGGIGGHLDEMIWQDLHQAEQLRLSGELILGNGASLGTQFRGLLPPNVAIGTSLSVYAPNGNTESGQAFSYGDGGTALLTSIAQCVSAVTRARGRRPSHILTNPWVWDLLSSQTDQQSRPLVDGHGPHPVPSGAEPEPGVVGCMPGIGLGVLGDLNVGDSFGGGISPPAQPYLGPVNGAQVAYQPGTGASALYTPLMPIVAKDIVVFLGEPKMRLMREVLAGTLSYRFQVYRYAAALVNRYVAAGSGSIANSGGWAAGACTSYGVITQFGANSLLSRTGQGF